MGEAIQEVVSGEETAIITKWIVIAESINDEGKKVLWTTCHDDMDSWDSLGMLNFAVIREEAAIRDLPDGEE